MRTLPIDTKQLGDFLLLAIEPDKDQSGKQKATKDGQPIWVADCYVRYGNNRELLKIKIHGVQPQVPIGPVTLVGLTARPYQIDGRSGISFVAQGIQTVKGAQS